MVSTYTEHLWKVAALVTLLMIGGQESLRAEPAALNPLPLWPNGAPDALGTASQDIPTLTAYLPTPNKATGAAIIVCPGGGYGWLAPAEGAPYAMWLADHGVVGLVLKYRLGNAGYHHPAMLHDAARAVRLTRAHAAEWKIDPRRVGIMGSSAGGHLAATLLTHFDSGNPGDPDPVEQQTSRPDFGILCYPVITMKVNATSGTGESSTRDNLLGKNPSPDLVDLLSNEKHVTRDTPPCFIWQMTEDKRVNVSQNAIAFATALAANGVPFELHLYEKGVHGMGLGGNPPGPYHRWTSDCLAWLHERGITR